ncbi:MAG TPA: hypothetical protein PL125_06060 [Candidatus Omnitrophota bacterium]|nr:hypothetical protein [Candidatus Omnitrophota bacterium]HPT39740.1 hypothetical protein [Candidatus Omnitrophota bacterium]
MDKKTLVALVILVVLVIVLVASIGRVKKHSLTFKGASGQTTTFTVK